MKTIRLIELFAGYGSQALALKRLGLPFEHYRVVEFDKYAIKSYNAIHNTDFNVTDIRDVKGEDLGTFEDPNYTYLLTYSFPCTDLSLAGNMQGMKKGSGTRSGLLWEVERLLREINEAENLRLPQVLLMENVPQVHSEQNIKDFGEWITFLDSLGYISKWQDLNAKDYGVAQNRERCFMVSYLDKSLKFAFPSPIKLTKAAKDYLEDSVNEKYFIKTEKAEELINKLILESEPDKEIIKVKANTNEGFYELEPSGVVDLSYPDSKNRRGRVQTRGRVCPTITSSGDISKIEREVVERSTTNPRAKTVSNCLKAGQRGIIKHQAEETGVLEKITNPEPICLNSKDENGKQPSLTDRVYSSKGAACCITTSPFFNPHYLIEKEVVEERTDEGLRTFLNALCGALRTTDSCGDKRAIEAKCIQVGEISNNGFESRNRVDSVEGCFTTLQTSKDFNAWIVIEYRIRKLTPLECLRLMDVDDEDAYKMLAVNSETQVYKQAGNSIVVAVMVAIFKNLFLGGSEKEQTQLDIFDILE